MFYDLNVAFPSEATLPRVREQLISRKSACVCRLQFEKRFFDKRVGYSVVAYTMAVSGKVLPKHVCLLVLSFAWQAIAFCMLKGA